VRRSGWLAAASVAGLSALVAFQVEPPVQVQPPPAPAGSARTQSPAESARPVVSDRTGSATEMTAVPPPPARAQAPTLKSAPAPLAVAPAATSAVAEPPPALELPRARAAPFAPAAPAPSADASEAVVTGARAPWAQAASARRESTARPADQAAQLRAAAAAGRVAELTVLLARGAPIDAPDEEGETALMKAVQANHPAAAALRRGRGASLELKNRAGYSARDMAASVGEAELNRALGLSP
jgi:hypothetical protein